MIWVIGCDEAGYGPPLGAFTQASVAMLVPGSIGAIEDTWSAFPDLFRRRKGAAKAIPGEFPLVIDDSKLVTQLSAGIEHLGLLWPLLFGYPNRPQSVLNDLLNWAHLPDRETYQDDPTFNESFPLQWTVPESIQNHAEQTFRKYGLTDRRARVSMVSPAVFNRLIDLYQNKSAVLEKGWQSHIRWWVDQLPGETPLVFISDRLGGKKSYAGIFQEALGGTGLVQVVKEDDNQSSYRCLGSKREIMLMVNAKADSKYLAVASASMLAKHLRETSMDMVNQFWKAKVPNLKPTAGYPEDGKRFYGEIQLAMAQSGIKPDQVWRKR